MCSPSSPRAVASTIEVDLKCNVESIFSTLKVRLPKSMIEVTQARRLGKGIMKIISRISHPCLMEHPDTICAEDDRVLVLTAETGGLVVGKRQRGSNMLAVEKCTTPVSGRITLSNEPHRKPPHQVRFPLVLAKINLIINDFR